MVQPASGPHRNRQIHRRRPAAAGRGSRRRYSSWLMFSSNRGQGWAWRWTPAVWRVGDGVLAKVGSVVAPQGVMATARIPELAPLANTDFVVELAGVADPGNAGTIVRSAVAAGAQAVVFSPGSVDPWNPKTVRASAGALFRVPLSVPAPVGERVGADPNRGDPCDQVDLTGPLTLVVGNESHGLEPDRSRRPLGVHPHGRGGRIPERGLSRRHPLLRNRPPTPPQY